MKAVVAQRGSSVPHVVEVEAQAVGPDDVRLTVAAAGFTYFDAFVPTVQEAFGLPEQFGLGFDFSGTVTEVGEGVTGLAVGDRVAGLLTDLASPVRAHAEELVVPAATLAHVPDGLDLDVAAVAPLSALTARQSLDLLGDERGRLLVTGASGSIGEWLTVLAAREGWDVTGLVRGVEVSGPFDAVLDAADLKEQALDLVRDGGRYVGFKPGAPVEAPRGIDVSTVMVEPDAASLADLLPLAASGDVPVRVAGRAPLSDAAAAYEQASAGSGSRGRWLLVP